MEPTEDSPGQCKIALSINGSRHEVEVPNNWTLNDLLRNRLGLTGTKRACDYGGCGSCTVLMDGVDVYSCSVLAVQRVALLRGMTSSVAACGLPQPCMRFWSIEDSN